MEEQENLASTANLSKSIADVQELLDRLNQTRAMIEAGKSAGLSGSCSTIKEGG